MDFYSLPVCCLREGLSSVFVNFSMKPNNLNQYLYRNPEPQTIDKTEEKVKIPSVSYNI